MMLEKGNKKRIWSLILTLAILLGVFNVPVVGYANSSLSGTAMLDEALRHYNRGQVTVQADELLEIIDNAPESVIKDFSKILTVNKRVTRKTTGEGMPEGTTLADLQAVATTNYFLDTGYPNAITAPHDLTKVTSMRYMGKSTDGKEYYIVGGASTSGYGRKSVLKIWRDNGELKVEFLYTTSSTTEFLDHRFDALNEVIVYKLDKGYNITNTLIGDLRNNHQVFVTLQNPTTKDFATIPELNNDDYMVIADYSKYPDGSGPSLLTKFDRVTKEKVLEVSGALPAVKSVQGLYEGMPIGNEYLYYANNGEIRIIDRDTLETTANIKLTKITGASGTTRYWKMLNDTHLIVEKNGVLEYIDLENKTNVAQEFTDYINVLEEMKVLANRNFVINGEDTQNAIDNLSPEYRPDEVNELFSYLSEGKPNILGKGTEESPYLIENAKAMEAIKFYPKAHFRQIKDIDATNLVLANVVAGNFDGVYDGDNFKLSNYNLGQASNVSFASALTDTGVLRNMVFENYKANGLVGTSYGTIENIIFESGEITSTPLIATTNYGVIKNIYSDVTAIMKQSPKSIIATSNAAAGRISDVTVEGELIVDGATVVAVVSADNRGTITRAYSSTIFTYKSGGSGVESYGIAKNGSTGLVTNSSRIGDIRNPHVSAKLTVGIAGLGSINKSYVSGTIEGGIGTAGIGNQANITDSYIIGDIVAPESVIDGLINSYGSSTGTFISQNAYGVGHAKSLVGAQSLSQRNTNMNSAYGPYETVIDPGTGGVLMNDLKVKSTFTGFNFYMIWDMDTTGVINSGYPFLRDMPTYLVPGLPEDGDKDLQEATQAVEKAETTKKQEDLDSARDLVNDLSESDEKQELSDRLDTLQNEIDKANKLKEAEEAIDDVGDKLVEVKANPTEVNITETEELIEIAKDLLSKLENSNEKTGLVDRLTDYENQLNEVKNGIELQDSIDNIEKELDRIKDLINNLGENPLADDIDEIQNLINDLNDLVDKLPDGEDKTRLKDEIELVQKDLDSKKEEGYIKDIVDNANNKVAEIQDMINDLKNNITEEGINKVQDEINDLKTEIGKLPSGSDKDLLENIIKDLQEQLDEIKNQFEINKGLEITQGNLNIAIGDKVQLNNTSSLDVVWESSNEAVVSISNTGIVTGLSAGSAVITVTIKGTNVSDSITVTVLQDKVNVTGFGIVEDRLELEIEDTATLTFEVNPLEATDKRVTWNSSNSAVAHVVNGKITALSKGTVVITGTTVDGGFTDSVTVVVKEEEIVTPVSITAELRSSAWGKVAIIDVEVTGDYKEITLPNGAKIYTDKFSYTARENDNYIFSVLGKDGNSTDSVSVEVSSVDKIAPIILFNTDPSDITNVSVDVLEDESGLKELITPKGQKVTTMPYEFDSSREQGTFAARDNANNVSSKDFSVSPIIIGNSATHTYVVLEGVPQQWTNINATIKVLAQNNVDGIQEILLNKKLADLNRMNRFMAFGEYMLHDQPIALMSGGDTGTVTSVVYGMKVNELTMNNNGVVQFSVINALGEYSSEVEIGLIDKIDPILELEVDGSNITYVATDNLSGIRFIYLPNGEIIEVDTDEQLSITGDFELLANGTFIVSTEDYAGNITEEEFTLTYNKEDGNNTGDGEGTGTNPGEGEGTGTGTNPGEGTNPGDGTTPGEGEGTNTGDGEGTGTNPGEGTNTGDGEGTGTGTNPGRDENDYDDEDEDDKVRVEETREYKQKYDQLIASIPFTVLRNSELDWNKITGIKNKDLKVTVDLSKVGVTNLEVNLLGVKTVFKIEVLDLIENREAMDNVTLSHWASKYVIQAIQKGFIKGGTNGELMLENTLAVSDSFTALDRLLLSHNMIEMKTDRDVVDSRTKGIKDTWYTYTVKSILSKYNKEDLNKLEVEDFERVITREEIAQVLYNSLQGKLEENSEMIYYSDLLESDNAQALIFCTKSGLLQGYNGKVNPKGNLTRAEFMTIITRLDNILDK